jgi:predicted double-glycine peptidase|tara:strand:- start:258 stop:518 length:261 start_codon:yes stop_codon:yes gene_type:complete
MKKHILQENYERLFPINEAPNRDIVRQWEMTEMDFISGIRKIKQMMDKTTGSRTSSRILDKAFGKQVSPLMDKLTKLINDLSATNK